ncbi:hypothetical protein B0T18DRAFT_116924 [Schizothecium vesticola]|uniref:Uncharacterized protein n=1 Tax=Schizothecium vesticola TaxID=314040 RepID=A0AA40F278_9PEZI|nr:hypothetical protein B0T18DRAFT_116924 [Schizothecium vesticola]
MFLQPVNEVSPQPAYISSPKYLQPCISNPSTNISLHTSSNPTTPTVQQLPQPNRHDIIPVHLHHPKHPKNHPTQVEPAARDLDTPPPWYSGWYIPHTRPPRQPPPSPYHNALFFARLIILKGLLAPAKAHLAVSLSVSSSFTRPFPHQNINATMIDKRQPQSQRHTHTPPNAPSHTHQDELNYSIPRQTPCPGPLPTPCTTSQGPTYVLNPRATNTSPAPPPSRN